jgi:hypothetical protein
MFRESAFQFAGQLPRNREFARFLDDCVPYLRDKFQAFRNREQANLGEILHREAFYQPAKTEANGSALQRRGPRERVAHSGGLWRAAPAASAS